MFRVFNCCLLTALFIMVNISIPFKTGVNTIIAETNTIDCESTITSACKITESTNMSEYNDAYYCDILGGVIEIELCDLPFSTHLLSLNYILLKVNNISIKLKPNTLYSLSYYNENNSTYLMVDGVQYELLHRTISINFLSFGAFGNIKIVNLDTYHDNTLIIPYEKDISIAFGTATITNSTINFYPKPLTDFSDTVTQFILIESFNRLTYYTLTNHYCIEKTENINANIFTISDDYTITSIESPDLSMPAEINGNDIKFYSSGEYCIILIKDSYKTIINLKVILPNIDIDPTPPEPDLPPDNSENPDDIEPPTPPDIGDDLPPDSGDLPPNIDDGETPPPSPDDGITDDSTSTEEILPPNSDSSDTELTPDFNINYERKVDYVKVIIVAVCGIFGIGGIVTLSIIITKIKKRKKEIKK